MNAADPTPRNDAGPLYENNPFGKDITLDLVEEDLEFLDDWESRYGYIIDLGRKVPQLPDALKSEENRVHGCQSQVWFVMRHQEDGRVQLLIDSDAMIVRGLAALVMTALNEQPRAKVASYDMEALFQRLDLIRHLSPTRGNGLRAMVGRVQQAALT